MVKNVFIILGVIIIGSFIMGVVLTILEKKKQNSEVLTDDPKVLFEDSNDCLPLYEGKNATDGIDAHENISMNDTIEADLENGTFANESQSFVDNCFDEEII